MTKNVQIPNKFYFACLLYFMNIYSAYSNETINTPFYITNTNWKVTEYFEDRMICNDFIKEIKKQNSKISIIKPTVITNNWKSTKLHNNVKNCDKNNFVNLEIQSHSKLNDGQFVEMGTGRFITSEENYVLWKLKNNTIFFVGPTYTLNSDKKTKDYLNEGVFYDISPETCKIFSSSNGGRIKGFTGDNVKRKSQFLKFRDKTYLLAISKGHNEKLSSRLIEFQESHKTKFECSFYSK